MADKFKKAIEALKLINSTKLPKEKTQGGLIKPASEELKNSMSEMSLEGVFKSLNRV